MRRFNVVTKRTYENNGEERTIWLNVGRITEFNDGGMALELNMHPDTKFFVFPVDDQAQQQQSRQPQPKPQEPAIEYPADEINPDDIPF